MMWNDVDVYYSAPGGETTRGITTEDSELVFLESGYAHVDIGEHTVEINFVRLSPFTLQTLVEDFDINAVCAGFDIFPERQEYESAAFDDWISDRVLRPVKVQSPARLCVRMAYKSMQLECPAEYDGMDPTDGEMAGEAYPKKLAALRAADFPEPRCFRGLSLRRRTEDGVFENTGEPRVFYHFERDDSEIADAGGGRTNPSEVVAGHVTRWGDVAWLDDESLSLQDDAVWYDENGAPATCTAFSVVRAKVPHFDDRVKAASAEADVACGTWMEIGTKSDRL
uniref:Uncharacterized protein n=2 Tax=Octactis speculum TaxID=3111310 RepID=A0A7S2GJP4_9STRA